MKDILTNICEMGEISIDTMEVMPDHVHMMISFKPKYAAADVGNVSSSFHTIASASRDHYTVKTVYSYILIG